MRFDFLMDICIRKLKHDIYVYIVSTVSPVALLGLHEIVGWWFFLKKIFPQCAKYWYHPPPPPAGFSLAAKESLILISFTAERL